MRRTLGAATRIYFRKVITVGEPPAETAGRLFAANHFNGIIDPLLILARARFDASPIAKSTLFKMPVLRSILAVAEAVPVVRRKDAPDKGAGGNDQVFEHVARHLGDGGNVLIFPEGVSHDEPHVLPLKSGAARMLSLAREKGASGLSLQTVALDFDARERFRSRVLVTYGPVHYVDEVAEKVGTGEALVQSLMTHITQDLDALVVQGESHGELFLARRIGELLANQAEAAGERGAAGFANQVEIARAVVQAAQKLGPEDPRYRAVVDSVDLYSRALSAASLTDRQIAGGRSLNARRLLRGLWLALLVPFALLGALLYFVPYRLPRLANNLAKGEIDVVSTYKLGIGLVSFPAWLALWTAFVSFQLPSWPARLLALAMAPISAWAALVWLDRLDDRRGARLLREASSTGQRELASLASLRSRALDAIAAARPPEQG